MDWYRVHKRSLPWRAEKDPYKVWLSEIIMQQTRIEQGTPYYEKFIRNFPTVHHLAATSEEVVLKCWQGLGYYSRARNLHRTAQMVVELYKGFFPKTYKELLALKGVGDYTASAIGSICYDLPLAVLDGNVYRVLSRYFGVDTPINTTEGHKYFKSLAEKVLCKSNAGDYNQAIMDFGATVCKPQSPHCADCPLESKCVAYHEKRIAKLPVKLKKLKIKHRYLNFVIFADKNQRVWLEKRAKGIWQGLYQFPLVETKTSVGALTDVAQLNLKNQLSIKGSNDDFKLLNTEDWSHKLTHQHLHVKFWYLSINADLKHDSRFKIFEKYPVPKLLEKCWDAFFVVSAPLKKGQLATAS